MTIDSAIRFAFCFTVVFVSMTVAGNILIACLAAIGVTGLAALAIYIFAAYTFVLKGGPYKIWIAAANFYEWFTTAMKKLAEDARGATNATN